MDDLLDEGRTAAWHADDEHGYFTRLNDARCLRRTGGMLDPTYREANPAYPVLPMRSGRKLLPFLLATRRLAGRVRQPSLVAHGAHDRITLPMGARQLAGRLASDQVWQLRLARSAHVITLDHDRQRLGDTAVAFLEQML